MGPRRERWCCCECEKYCESPGGEPGGGGAARKGRGACGNGGNGAWSCRGHPAGRKGRRSGGVRRSPSWAAQPWSAAERLDMLLLLSMVGISGGLVRTPAVVDTGTDGGSAEMPRTKRPEGGIVLAACSSFAGWSSRGEGGQGAQRAAKTQECWVEGGSPRG